MPSNDVCPFCGCGIAPDQAVCPGCGAPLAAPDPASPRDDAPPETIEALRAYCEGKHMPLAQMRFFIGEDQKEPRAFGIFRDGGDVVVYKNKADGSRAIRYRGPDEARGVGELYQKLLEECHARGIFPDAKPSAPVRSSGRGARSRKRTGFLGTLEGKHMIALVVAAVLCIIGANRCGVDYNGYYRFPDTDRIYYHSDGDWFFAEEDSDVWYETDEVPAADYTNYSLGEEWSEEWGVGDIRDSELWEERAADEFYDDDDDDGSYDDGGWDDWDSDDTDWDSDW